MYICIYVYKYIHICMYEWENHFSGAIWKPRNQSSPTNNHSASPWPCCPLCFFSVASLRLFEQLHASLDAVDGFHMGLW